MYHEDNVTINGVIEINVVTVGDNVLVVVKDEVHFVIVMADWYVIKVNFSHFEQVKELKNKLLDFLLIGIFLVYYQVIYVIVDVIKIAVGTLLLMTIIYVKMDFDIIKVLVFIFLNY